MRMYRRHSGLDIFIHWWNAGFWIFLLLTGLGLVRNPAMNLLGDWYPAWLRGLFGGGGTLLAAHQGAGIAWLCGFLVYLAFNLSGALFFLRQVFQVDPGRDIPWLVRKPARMLLGRSGMRKLGMNPTIPDQGFYNMGQKAFGQASVIGSLALAATGVVMLLSQTSLGAAQTGLVSWAILLHYLAALLVFAGLLAHVYMAAISPEERPGLRSMFTGVVPEDYARHHHKLWHDAVKDSPVGE